MVVPQQAFAMHIMEGFLPPVWALAWWLLFLPCLWYGLVRLRRIVQRSKSILLNCRNPARCRFWARCRGAST
ncbi:cobalt transport protein CbiM [Salmonella enterica subsp. enterica serovar Enteritidis str. 50-5646]|nr:cobalt transport protein CbiM [Salmonella enterica subsp. enterica serovar Enteritidis str. 50-5646]